MKRRILTHLVLSLLLTALPMIPALAARGTEGTDAMEAEMPEFVEFTMESEPSEPDDQPPFLVLDAADGEVMEVPVRDYVIGAVCAEMPASFEPEALKAQAVAAHTYAHRIPQRCSFLQRQQPLSGVLYGCTDP